jgi:hypothetical protein
MNLYEYWTNPQHIHHLKDIKLVFQKYTYQERVAIYTGHIVGNRTWTLYLSIEIPKEWYGTIQSTIWLRQFDPKHKDFITFYGQCKWQLQIKETSYVLPKIFTSRLYKDTLTMNNCFDPIIGSSS